MAAAKVSAKLLQKCLVALEEEAQLLRDIVFSVIEAQGRIRIPRATLAGLSQGQGLDVRMDEEGMTVEVMKER